MKKKSEEFFYWKDWRRYHFLYLLKRIWRLIFLKKEKEWFDDRLLMILQCPLSQQGLRWLPEVELARLNAALSVKALCNCQGELVQGTITVALVRENGKFLYWGRHEIADLTKGGAIRLFWY